MYRAISSGHRSRELGQVLEVELPSSSVSEFSQDRSAEDVKRNGSAGGSRSRLPHCGAVLRLLRLPNVRPNRVENSRFPALFGGRYAESSHALLSSAAIRPIAVVLPPARNQSVPGRRIWPARLLFLSLAVHALEGSRIAILLLRPPLEKHPLHQNFFSIRILLQKCHRLGDIIRQRHRVRISGLRRRQ